MTDEQIEEVAFRMFCRNMEDFAFDDGMLMLAWLDDGTRDFWVKQARAIERDMRDIAA
jgi:hypothetical protein